MTRRVVIGAIRAIAIAADAVGIAALAWVGYRILFSYSASFMIEAAWVGVIGTIACLAHPGSSKRMPAALVVLTAAALVSAAVNRWPAVWPDPSQPINTLFRTAYPYVFMLIFVFGAAHLLRTRLRLAWFTVTVAGAIVVLAVQILFDRAATGFVYNRGDMVSLPSVAQLSGIHQAGFVLVTGLPLCLALGVTGSTLSQIASGGVLSATLIASGWVNGSRTSVISMAVVCAAVVATLATTLKIGRRRALLWSAMAAAPIAIAALLFTSMSSMPAVTSITGDRAPIWRATAQIFFDHPLVGVGPGNYTTVMLRDDYAERFLPWYPAIGGREQAHNLPLQVAAETGIAGVAALLLFFAWAWQASRRAYAHMPVIALGIGFAVFAIFVRCLFDNFLGLEVTADRMRPFVWIFFAAAVAVGRLPPGPTET